MMSKRRFWFVVFVGLAILSALYSACSRNGEKPEKIIVVGDKSYTPFEYLDINGAPQGISVDVWRLWEQKTGIEVDYRLYDWSDALALIDSGKADAISGFFYSRERTQKYLYSKPYFQVDTHIFFASALSGIRTLDDLSYWTVGMVEGDIVEEFLNDNGFQGQIKIQKFPSYQNLIEAAVAESISVFICDTPIALYHLARNNALNRFLHTENPLYSNYLYSGVKKGRSNLLNQIDKGFAAISDKEMSAISEEWLGVSYSMTNLWDEYWWLVLLAVAVVLVIIIWNRLLSRKVDYAILELKESQVKYRELIEHLDDVVFEVTPKGFVAFVNTAVEKISGYKPQELEGKRFVGFVHHDDAEEVAENLEKVFQGEKRIVAFRIISKNKNIKWLRSSSHPIYHEGRVVGLRGILMDITQNVEYENALRSSETKYRSLVENSSDAIYLMYNHKIEMVNKKFLQLFELNEQDIGQPGFNFVNFVRKVYREEIL